MNHDEFDTEDEASNEMLRELRTIYEEYRRLNLSAPQSLKDFFYRHLGVIL